MRSGGRRFRAVISELASAICNPQGSGFESLLRSQFRSQIGRSNARTLASPYNPNGLRGRRHRIAAASRRAWVADQCRLWTNRPELGRFALLVLAAAVGRQKVIEVGM